MPKLKSNSYCGIDFGTTNSSLSIIENTRPVVVPIDTDSSNQFVLKSLLYLNPSQSVSVGSGATRNYLHDLETLPSKPPRIVVTGRQIKVMVSTGSGVMKADWVPEIIETDDSGRGRLLQSLKSVLTSSTFTGTNVFGKFYTLEDLLTLLLTEIKTRAENNLQRPLDSVVLGRPVKYVGSGLESTALSRMKQIAQNSGFKNIEFELEPIGAALNYGLNISHPQNILVFDFGGGTLDVCIMKLPEKKVLAVSGRAIGGDLLNSRILQSQLLPFFGSQSLINGKMEFPRHLLISLASWYQTTLLKNTKDVGLLQDLIIKSNQPDKVKNFLNLVINDYGFEFFRTVDQAKIDLSTQSSTQFNFSRPNLHITQSVSRRQFETAINDELEESRRCIFESINLASLKPENIDKVILTGGSSQVPLFHQMISNIFTPEKLISSDHFTAVALGLGIRAQQIFS